MKRDLTIEIAGQALTIRSDENEAYVHDLASSWTGRSVSSAAANRGSPH
jgi:hypothetical protein